jgi:type IV secretion system protein VirD4
VARRFDAIGAGLLAAIAVLAAVAGWAALHFGWFRSPWELAGLVVVCAAFLAVGLPSQTAQESIAHSKFATRLDVEGQRGITEEAKPESEQGIYLGRFIGEGRKLDGKDPKRLRYKGPKHLICFGPTRSGKSASIITPNLQNLRRSIIVIDPKAELAAITEEHRASFGKTIVLNPSGLLVDDYPRLKSVGWNPLLQLDQQSKDFAGDAMCIADAIIEKSSSGGNSDYFDRQAKNAAQALIMWERMQNGRNASLRNIPKMITGRTVNQLTINDTTLIQSTDSDTTSEQRSGFMPTLEKMAKCKNDVVANWAARMLERLNDKNSQTTDVQNVIETLLSHFGLINNEHIAADMEHGRAIDFGKLHREITTIYLIMPPKELRENPKWLRLFVNLALRKLYDSPPSAKAPPTLPRVLFMLDEFGNLGRLQEVVSALYMAAYARIQLVFFLQDFGQLKRAYEGEMSSFFSGAGAMTTFAPGALDNETKEHLAKAFGNQEKHVQTETQGGGSVKPEAIPLIRAEDIGRLGFGETITMIEPCKWPVETVAPIYIDMPYFNEGLAPSPYPHG